MGEKGGWENFPTYFFLFCFVEGNKKNHVWRSRRKKNEGEIADKQNGKRKDAL